MKIQYASDLHLEFPENRNYIKKNPLQVKGDILILAGDILLLSDIDKYEWFFDFCSNNFKYTYWICGNHEFYHSDDSKRMGAFSEEIRNNVFLANNIVVQHDGLNLIFSTMWSKISPQNEYLIERGMSDFKVVKYNGKRFSAPIYNTIHKQCLDFLTEQTQKPFGGTKIVVTHHCSYA